jgi:hypothetical protein
MPERPTIVLEQPMSGRFARVALAALMVAAAERASFAFSNLPTTVPPEPTLTVAKDTGTGDVVLSWTATTGPYTVVRNTNPNFSGSPSAQILAPTVSGTQFRDPVLTDGITYYYKIEDANAVPRIFSASANAGSPGDAITLTGVGFDPASPADNTVLIGGVPAGIIVVSNTSLTYTTPPGVTGLVVVKNKNGVGVSTQVQYVVATSGLTSVSSVAVDGAHIPFVADTGGGATSDKVFKFDPSTGTRTQVGSLNEATGLPVDNSNRAYYGNALLNVANFGTIRRTDGSGADAVYRACGNSGSGDNCYVFGIGLDPSLTDFGPDGRVYVADGAPAAQKVRIVPPSGTIVDFATGFTFGGAPRGIVVDRNSTSPLFRDVVVSDSTSVRRYNSSTVPGVLQKTYNTTNSPIVSPRQMAITPFAPKERLLVVDDGLQRVVVVNPATDKTKVVDIPLTNPRAIELDQDVAGTTFAYVGEPTRVLKFPVHDRTVYLAIWIADNVIQPVEVQRHVNLARAALEKCGVDVQVRSINGFSAGNLLDLEVVDLQVATNKCGNPSLTRTGEEAQLLDNTGRRSTDATDLNVYYVRNFTVGNISPPPFGNAGETVTQDCFASVTDQMNSGVILDATAIHQKATDAVSLLVHEIVHALLYQPSWGTDEHNDQSATPYTGSNVMSGTVSRGTLDLDTNQCGNIQLDLTLFRGDP